MTSSFTPRIDEIVEVSQRLDRRAAVSIIREDLERGPHFGIFWQDVAQLAGQFGEQNLAIEAAKRFAATPPQDMDNVMYHASILVRFGFVDEAVAVMGTLPASSRNHPAVLHLRAVCATQVGDFDRAIEYIEKALAISPAPVQWLALSVAKKFKKGDPDIARMEAILPRIGRAPPEIKGQMLYALGKAYDDAGDIEMATKAYMSGAASMRQAGGPPRLEGWERYAKQLIAGYTKENLARLKPSGATDDRVIFVTGFPRSGTTLAEQILVSHSQVVGGAELNRIPIALMPAGNLKLGGGDGLAPEDISTTYPFNGDFNFEDALAYQTRSASSDPWGDIGRDFLGMITQRFGPTGKAIDKTVTIGQFVGLILHSLPNSKIVWMRRRPEDNALSVFRLYSQPGTIPWSYSLTDIAKFFKVEDRLYEHWAKIFPDRILTVPYEELVSSPETWIPKILHHVGLDEEPQVFEPHKAKRAISTASVAQVRAPISTSRIGAAEAYGTFMDEFRKAYYS